MGIQIRLPNITGASEKEQLVQLKSYLYQLSEELQWAFDNIDTTGGSGNGYVVKEASRGFTASPGGSGANAEATFASIKALIIKSADIVNAYYDEINTRLEGLYVAQSDFGAFAEKTTQDIQANSTGITQAFENVQIIIRDTKSELEGDLQVLGEDLSYAQQEVIVLKGDVEDINGNIASVETEIGELDTTLQNTKVELSGAIASTKTELSGSINNAKSELNNAVNDTKNELNGSIDNAKSELSGNINDTKNALNGSIDNAVANANAYTDSAKEEAKGYTDGAKSELDGKISETASELDGKISEANGRIDDTNSAVGNLGDGLDAANGRIDDVADDLVDTKTALNTEIQRVSDSVSTIDRLRLAAEEALKGSIDDLEFDLAGLRQIVVGVTAYIKSGLIYTTDAGIPVYGIEIGQEVEANGASVFNKFARFTSEKLSFYDANGNEVAYISDKKLYIGQAEITISLKVGGLVDYVMNTGDVVTKWEGGS